MQMGRHGLALEYARTAVVHCRSALSEAEEAQQQEAGAGIQPPSANTYNRNEGEKTLDTSLESDSGMRGVLSTLAIACHNLAVELEFVDGPSASVKWYQQAVRVATRAQEEASQAPTTTAASSGLNELRAGLEAALASALRKVERNDQGQRPNQRLPSSSSSSSSAHSKPNKIYDMKMAPPWAPCTRDAKQTNKCGLLVTPTPLSNLNTQKSYSGPTGIDGAKNNAPAMTQAAVTRNAQKLRTTKAAPAAATDPPAYSDFDFGDFWERDATAQFMTPSANVSMHREKSISKSNGHTRLPAASSEDPSKEVADLSPLEQAALSPETAMGAGAAESRTAAAAQRHLQEANEMNAMRRPGGHLEGPETARREALRRHEDRWSPPPANRPPSRQASDDASSGWPSNRESPSSGREHLRRCVTPPMPALGAAQALSIESLATKDARLQELASTAAVAAPGPSSPTSDHTRCRQQQQAGRPTMDARHSMAKARIGLGLPLEVGYASQPNLFDNAQQAPTSAAWSVHHPATAAEEAAANAAANAAAVEARGQRGAGTSPIPASSRTQSPHSTGDDGYHTSTTQAAAAAVGPPLLIDHILPQKTTPATHRDSSSSSSSKSSSSNDNRGTPGVARHDEVNLPSCPRSAPPPPLNLQGQPVAAGRWLKFQQEQNELRERAAAAPRHHYHPVLPHFAPLEDDGYGGRSAAATRLLSNRGHKNKQPVKPKTTRPSSAPSSSKPRNDSSKKPAPAATQKKPQRQHHQEQQQQPQRRRRPGNSHKGKPASHMAATNYSINSRGIPVPISAVSLPLNTGGLMSHSNATDNGPGQATWLRFNARGLPVSVRPETAPEAAHTAAGRRNGQKSRTGKRPESLTDDAGRAVPPRQMAFAYESAKAAALLALSLQGGGDGHDQPGALHGGNSESALAVGAASLALRALRETLSANSQDPDAKGYNPVAVALAAPVPGIFRPSSPSEQNGENEGPLRPGTNADKAAANERLEAENLDENYDNEDGESLSPQQRPEKDDVSPHSGNAVDSDVPSSEKKDSGPSMVGRTVQKEFGEDGWFAGSVVAAKWFQSAGTWQYEVVYEDGDVELLDISELKAIIEPAEIAAGQEGAVAPNDEVNPSAGQAVALLNGGGDISGAEDVEKLHSVDGGADGSRAVNPPTSAFHSFSPFDHKTGQEDAPATSNLAAAMPVADMSIEEMMVSTHNSLVFRLEFNVHAFVFDIFAVPIDFFLAPST